MTPCDLWHRQPTSAGYGRIWDKDKKRMVLVHRWAYEQAYGEIPTGLVVMHKCDTPLCFRPDHLELGTQRDNLGDMARKGRGSNQNKDIAACKNGHPFDDENTYINKTTNKRACRACRREWARLDHRQKAAKNATTGASRRADQLTAQIKQAKNARPLSDVQASRRELP